MPRANKAAGLGIFYHFSSIGFLSALTPNMVGSFEDVFEVAGNELLDHEPNLQST